MKEIDAILEDASGRAKARQEYLSKLAVFTASFPDTYKKFSLVEFSPSMIVPPSYVVEGNNVKVYKYIMMIKVVEDGGPKWDRINGRVHFRNYYSCSGGEYSWEHSFRKIFYSQPIVTLKFVKVY